jgi:apolipoprotein N-acyltransferase
MAALGAVSALAFAPFYLWPLWFITFPALAWTLDGCRSTLRPWRATALTAWAFGFGYFLAGLHWIGFAFLVDAEGHAWQLPFVALLFPGGLAIFFSLAAVAALFARRTGFARVVILACALAVAEWLRGHVLTGLPWNLPGYVWGGSDVMIQSVSVYGIYGLSLVTLIAVLAPAAAVDSEGRSSAAWWSLIMPVVVISGLLVFGVLRVPDGAAGTMPGVTLRLVQPNVPQAEKWKPELLQRNWKQLVDLTRSEGLEGRSHVIWPEAAPPFLLLTTEGALDVLAQVLPDNATLISGTQRFEPGDPPRFFNSLAVVDGWGRVRATYDKSHLVPFGEYLPFFRLLEPLGISQLTGKSGGFTPGDGVRVISVPGTPGFSPLICYEMICPGEVTGSGVRPDWMVSITDDSWFGPWTGPYQHLGIARVRAVEEGLAVARAANTGVSAVIDPYGRITASLGIDRAGVVDAALPKPLNQTLFSLAGDAIFFLLVLLFLGAALIFSRATSNRQLTVTTM